MGTTTDSKNLMQAIIDELARNRELLKQYESIPVGQFGALHIRQTIAKAESAIASGDVVAMLVEYENLKESQ